MRESTKARTTAGSYQPCTEAVYCHGGELRQRMLAAAIHRMLADLTASSATGKTAGEEEEEK